MVRAASCEAIFVKADVSRASAAWLCSERASFILGHALSVDSGMVAG